MGSSELVFSYTADPFAFAVKRKSNGQILFNSSSDESDPYSSLVFKDQYLEISTKLPNDASLYGLGENTQPHGIKLHPGDPYTLYTLDVSAINLNTDLYGSHPVYVDLRNVGGQGVAHAVLLLNSNGMDVFYRGTSLTYKVIGGVFDFYFFSGPTPLAVVDQYTALIGRPAPMPYWALGEFTNLSLRSLILFFYLITVANNQIIILFVDFFFFWERGMFSVAQLD
ncbi:NAD(P)H-dependent D-xylose reductase (XR) [Sarracenia purpurea var. burkii]